MALFTVICDVVGFVSNICIFILTVYTLYLTAFSKRMNFVSMGQSSAAFFGESLHFYIRNRSLHSIPITKVFLLKRIGGLFHMITVADYKQPLIVDAWHIEKIEMEPFTHIEGIDEPDYRTEKGSNGGNKDEDCDGEPSLATIHMDAVIGLETGNKVIWIKPYKKAPLRAAKRAYKKYNFDTLCVSRTCYNDKILSKAVNFVIHLLVKDLNGHNEIKSIFAIAGDQHILLSDSICGCNGIDGHFEISAKKLERCLCDRFGIDKKNISVEQIKSFL